MEYSDTPTFFGTGDILFFHRLLQEAADKQYLVSTKQLAELTDIKADSANAKPDIWSKWGFLFTKLKLDEGGVVWSIRRVVLTE